MATGTIKHWSQGSRNGYIEPDDGGQKLQFSIKELQGIDRRQVKPGMRVSFTLNEKGRIDVVQLIDDLPRAEKPSAPQEQVSDSKAIREASQPPSAPFLWRPKERMAKSFFRKFNCYIL